jgi:hypothetical protein
LFVVAGAFSLYGSTRDANRMPAPDEIRTANARAVAQATEADVFRPYPRWFADARFELGALPVLMADPVDTWELLNKRRLLQLVVRDYLDDANAEADALGASHIETLHEGERYLVRALTLPSSRPELLWDGIDAVRDADVTQRTTDGAAIECSLWRNEAWHCGRPNAYINVGAGHREMGDENPRRVITMAAPEAGAHWVIAWEDVPSAGATLRFRAGNEFSAIRSDRGSPVEFAALIDGAEVFRRTWGIHETGFEAFEFTLPDAPTADLVFEMRADDHFDRFFGFRPQIVR